MSAPKCRICFLNKQNIFNFYIHNGVTISKRSFMVNKSSNGYHLSRKYGQGKYIGDNKSVLNESAGRLSKFQLVRKLSSGDTAKKLETCESPIILGIETSCDDTGAAVVDNNGLILGDSLNSQTKYHIKFGGILPKMAQNLHQENIHSVVQEALQKAQCTVNDVDAIATTVKPGFTMSLNVGLEYAKKLVQQSGKPFIPIHHMEAHALTARMIHKSVPFPFLTLLLSGGHCLLALVRDVEDFVLLGKGMDDAPGDAFDKIARRLKVRNIPEFSEISGGQAIEILARTGDPRHLDLLSVMSQHLDCNFSFSGIKSAMGIIIEKEEKLRGLSPAGVLPNLPDLCASFQYFVLHHLAKRLQRGFLFCELNNLLPTDNRTLVVSGGVASNQFIRTGLERICSVYDCTLVAPPPQLCTDNGVMIAWNGVEKMRRGLGVTDNIEAITVQSKCPLGEDWTERVRAAHIVKMQRIKLL